MHKSSSLKFHVDTFNLKPGLNYPFESRRDILQIKLPKTCLGLLHWHNTIFFALKGKFQFSRFCFCFVFQFKNNTTLLHIQISFTFSCKQSVDNIMKSLRRECSMPTIAKLLHQIQLQSLRHLRFPCSKCVQLA